MDCFAPLGARNDECRLISQPCGHFQKLSDSHLTLIAFLAAANRDNAIGNFLLSHNEEVRHLLEFALANLVAEFLTPSASAATPRSRQPASGLPRHLACSLFFTASAVIAFFRFFEECQVIFKTFFVGKASAINTSKLVRILIAMPISPS